MGQALDHAGLDRVDRNARHHNGDRRGRLPGSRDSRVTGTGRHDDVDVAPDEFGRQRWEEGDVAFRVAVVHNDVLPLHITQLPQTLLQGFVGVFLSWNLRVPSKNSYAIDFSRRLCLDGKGRHEETQGKGEEKRQCCH
jgi:hypothetical protein